MSRNDRIPPDVTKRILKRAANGEKAVVVTIKDGQPQTVWGVDEYVNRCEAGRKAGLSRKGKKKVKAVPDPLGAVNLGSIARPLSRENFYADE